MASLLRAKRACTACGLRSHCYCVQLLVPEGDTRSPVYRWFDMWLCPPCKRSVVSLADDRGVRGLQAVL